MTAVLGSTTCPHLGCSRKRHRSASGIHYGACIAHTLTRLSGAFRDSLSSTSAGPPSVGRRAAQVVPATSRAPIPPVGARQRSPSELPALSAAMGRAISGRDKLRAALGIVTTFDPAEGSPDPIPDVPEAFASYQAEGR